EEVVRVGELAREPGIVLRLARVEAGVLEDGQPVVGDRRTERLTHGLDREGWIRALRPAEMRADGDGVGIAVEQPPQRRQRGTDARVVGDAPVLEWHVEV